VNNIQTDGKTDASNPGYLKYTDGTSTVWVKATGTAPAITTTSLPGGTVGVAYSQTLAATGTTPITWSISAGSLPAGLSLNATTGVISGNPTTAGTSNFTVKATNGTGDATKALSITVAVVDAETPTIIAQPQSVTVKTGGAATLSVTASVSDGGTLSYKWYSNTTKSAGGGTVISSATGNNYSSPTTTTGTYYYYVVVTNTNNGVTGAKTATKTSAVATVTVTDGTGIENVSQATGLKAWIENGTLHVGGLTAGEKWSVYTISGTLLHQGIATGDPATLNATSLQRSVYIIKSENKTVKVAY